MFKLYDYWRSSAAYRVRIGLNLKGLAYEAVSINLAPSVSEQRGDAYRAINPQGRVPALATEQGLLTQSLAVLEWLEETHPTPAFLPRDPYARADVRAFALAIACDIHPLNNVSVLERLKTQFHADKEAVSAWYAHWIQATFAALEPRARAPFTFGAEPTLADICLVPQMANARRFGVDVSAFPRLISIDAHARKHPAFAKAAPEVQSDAVKGA